MDCHRKRHGICSDFSFDVIFFVYVDPLYDGDVYVIVDERLRFRERTRHRCIVEQPDQPESVRRQYYSACPFFR